MAATLWEPADVTTYSSVWMAGLTFDAGAATTESDVLVVRMTGNDSQSFSSSGSAISAWTGTDLTASTYATHSDGVITISETGVYEVTYVLDINASETTWESFDILNTIRLEVTDGSASVYPYYPIYHPVAATNSPAGSITRANFTDKFTVLVNEAPISFNPSVTSYGYSASGTYTGALTVIVRRSGSVLEPSV